MSTYSNTNFEQLLRFERIEEHESYSLTKFWFGLPKIKGSPNFGMVNKISSNGDRRTEFVDTM